MGVLGIKNKIDFPPSRNCNLQCSAKNVYFERSEVWHPPIFIISLLKLNLKGCSKLTLESGQTLVVIIRNEKACYKGFLGAYGACEL